MNSKTWIIVALGLMVFLQGCNTLKGVGSAAKEGIKKDWKAMKKADGWMEEHMW